MFSLSATDTGYQIMDTGNKTIHKLVALWHLVSLLILAMPSTPSVYAQNDSSTSNQPGAQSNLCIPIDVIFLMDQSHSMSVGGNDPIEQREYAIETAIDLIGDIALDSCPGIVNRVAVVSYGTNAQIDLQLRDIGPFSTEHPEEAFRIRDLLKTEIEATNLGQTNPAEAFAVAKQILDSASDPDDSGMPRKQAIIFVTDGIPCVDSDYGECGVNFNWQGYTEDMREQIEDDFPFDSILLGRENCLSALRNASSDPDDPLPPEDVTTCFDTYRIGPDAYNNSTYIWMLLMRDSGRSYPLTLENIFLEVVDGHSGELIKLSNNRSEVPSTFTGILEQLTGVRATRLECGNFAVNPYLRKAVLSFFKFENDTIVKVSYTDAVSGIEYVLENGISTPPGGFEVIEHNNEGPNERYVIDFPYPGVWKLSSDDCSGLDATYIPVKISPSSPHVPQVIPQFDREPFYNESFPQFMTFELRDEESGEKVAIPEHPHFTPAVSAVVEGPGGAQTFDFEWMPIEELFQATEPLTAKETGEYKATLQVTSMRHEGEITNVGADIPDVFDKEFALYSGTLTYEILPVTPFLLDIVTPAPDQEFKPIHSSPGLGTAPDIAPLPIRVQLTDRDGNAVFGDYVDLIFRNGTNNMVTATVTAPGGTQYVETLMHDVLNPGEFVGEILELGQSGDYELLVELDDSLSNARDYYPDNFSAESSFSRGDETWRSEILEPLDGTIISSIHDTPIEEGLQWPLRVAPLPIRVQLINEQGKPYADIETVMGYAPQVISATVSAGTQSGSTWLRPDRDNPGEYIGNIEDIDVSGEYRLRVDLDLEYPDYTPASEAAFSTFTRIDGVWHRPVTYYGLLVLLILILLFSIWRYRAARSNPVTGELLILESGEVIVSFALGNGRNKRIIKGGELKPYPQLGLKRIVVHRIAKSKGKDSAEDDFDVTYIEGQQEGILVDYVTEEGEKENRIPLGPNMPIPIGNASLFQMQYRPIDGTLTDY